MQLLVMARRPRLFLLYHFRGEPMLFDRLRQLVFRNLFRLISYEQQIQVFVRFDLSFPLVFYRLNTMKLFQSFLDLVRSGVSVNLQLLVHAGDVERDLPLSYHLGFDSRRADVR